jgi:hypothetical protein
MLSGQRACQHAQLGRPEHGPAVQLMQGSCTPLTRSLVHALQTMATLLFASVEEINALIIRLNIYRECLIFRGG